MRKSFGLAMGIVAVSSLALAAEKPLQWRELMTIAQPQPKTDVQWGMSEAQVRERHPQLFLSESIAQDDECSFVIEARSGGKAHALDYLVLKLPADASATCAEKWRAQLQSLYGKPTDSGPVQDLVVDADTLIHAEWNTPTSCIKLLYTRAGAPHPAPLTVTFGDKSTDACGYTDQVVTTVPRDRRR